MSTLIAVVLVAALYFLPTIIAQKRDKTNIRSIFLLNLFGGWSVLGWIIALIWAVQ